jgi:serine/threonine protein kinase
MTATLTKAGRYEITGEVGRGAMGVVYRANDPFIGRTVAVKTLQLSEQRTGLTREELLNRFQTEARAAGLLTHPNIVVVYDAGEEEGLFFITMELVEGKSLQAVLDSGQLFPIPRVLRVMEQACSALQFAHDRNIVHRDIKPANLMLTPNDTVKVTDFGTAKILQLGTVNQTAHVMGTPSYMSPEQVKGKAVDGRSDIFSLGVLLYEMVTGEKPFPGQSITTVIYKIVSEEPVAPRQLDPSIHPGLNAIILKALAKEPSQRYQHCRDLMDDLRNYRSLSVGENPSATLPLGIGSPHSHAATQLLDSQVDAAWRSLSGRAGGPSQTPLIRRTGTLPAAEPEPQRENTLATVLAAILLLCVIVFGAQKIRRVFNAARETRHADDPAPQPVQTTSPEPPRARTAGTDFTTTDTDASIKLAEEKPADDTPVAPARKPTEKVKLGPFAPSSNRAALSAAAAKYKEGIEKLAAEKHLRLFIKGSGSTLALSGKVRPVEHSDLLKFLRNAPSGIQVVDNLQYDDTAGSTTSKPAAAPGYAAIHIVANVAGAIATVGSGSSNAHRCETPCTFSDLEPGDYNLQVQKAGYQPAQTALQVKSGDALDQKVQLEPLEQGLFIASQPAGADVFINGDKQSGQTPLTVPLAPGKYNLVLRLAGFDAYVSQIEVRSDVQSKVNAELHQKNGHIAWAQINSFPEGAEIWLDGSDTGQHAPGRVEIPSGIHDIVLKLDGFQPTRQVIQASEGGTISVSKILSKAR